MLIGLYLVVVVFWEVSVRYDKQSQKKQSCTWNSLFYGSFIQCISQNLCQENFNLLLEGSVMWKVHYCLQPSSKVFVMPLAQSIQYLKEEMYFYVYLWLKFTEEWRLQQMFWDIIGSLVLQQCKWLEPSHYLCWNEVFFTNWRLRSVSPMPAA